MIYGNDYQAAFSDSIHTQCWSHKSLDRTIQKRANKKAIKKYHWWEFAFLFGVMFWTEENRDQLCLNGPLDNIEYEYSSDIIQFNRPENTKPKGQGISKAGGFPDDMQ